MRPEEAEAVESHAPVFISLSNGAVALFVVHEATEVQVEAPLAMVQLVGETVSEPVGEIAGTVTYAVAVTLPEEFETVYVTVAVHPA